jgi:hypothetical protein
MVSLSNIFGGESVSIGKAGYVDMETKLNIGWARSHCYFSHYQMSAAVVLRDSERCVKGGMPTGWLEGVFSLSIFQLIFKNHTSIYS